MGHPARAHGRAQAAARPARGRPGVPGPLPPRVGVGRAAVRAAHHPDPRLRGDQRQAVHRHAAGRRHRPGLGGQVGRPDGAAPRDRDPGAGGRGAGRRARGRAGAPRRQAVQRARARPRRGRVRLPDRLRHRPRRRRADERARADAHRGHPRHARLHGARAVREPARRRPGRRLLARLHAVRAAHRGGAVPRPHAGRDDPRARHAGSAAALGAPSGVAAGAGRRRGARDGQAAGAPLSDGGRAGGGGAGGARAGGARPPRRPR